MKLSVFVLTLLATSSINLYLKNWRWSKLIWYEIWIDDTVVIMFRKVDALGLLSPYKARKTLNTYFDWAICHSTSVAGPMMQWCSRVTARDSCCWSSLVCYPAYFCILNNFKTARPIYYVGLKLNFSFLSSSDGSRSMSCPVSHQSSLVSLLNWPITVLPYQHFRTCCCMLYAVLTKLKNRFCESW